MKVIIERPGPGEEEELIVRCHKLDDKLMKLIASLNGESSQVTGYFEDKIVKLQPEEIFYFETVDSRVFAYTRDEVYEIHKKLYELEEKYGGTDFLRISKSVIVNLSKIAYVRPIFNGRFEAKLKNQETIIISRQYVMKMKEKLELG